MKFDVEKIKTLGRRLSYGVKDNVYLYRGRVYKMCSLDDASVYSFPNEARIVKKLHESGCEFIPKFYGLHKNEKWMVLVYQYIRSYPLCDIHVKRQKEVVEVVRKLGEKKIVHRDLMPSNIIVSKPFLPFGSRVYLIDFQFARDFDAEMPDLSEVDRDDLKKLWADSICRKYRPELNSPLENYDMTTLKNVFSELFGERSILNQ